MTRTRTNQRPQRYHWADALACDVATSVVLRGPQTTNVRTGDDGTGRHVAASIGRVLIYLYDRPATLAHIGAWTRALEIAHRAFPAGHASPEPRNSQDRERPLMLATAAVQCAQEQAPISVDGATTAVAGHPYVQVQVGRLTVVCLDQDAVRSVAACWTEVAERLDAVFPDEDDVAEQRRVAVAFERSASPRPAAPPPSVSPRVTDLSGTAARLDYLEARMGRLERQREPKRD